MFWQKEEVMTVSEFLARDFKAEAQEKKERNMAYATAATTVLSSMAIYFVGFDGSVLAAGTGIDEGATKLYDKILLVGKWIIIVKGAIDTINNTAQGDFASAKKSFLSYLIIYLILKAFPWAMSEVDNMFSEIV